MIRQVTRRINEPLKQSSHPFAVYFNQYLLNVFSASLLKIILSQLYLYFIHKNLAELKLGK